MPNPSTQEDLFRRAEMRWMSVEDAEITVRARDLALLGRRLAKLEAVADKARQYLDTGRGDLDGALAALDAQDKALLGSPPPTINPAGEPKILRVRPKTTLTEDGRGTVYPGQANQPSEPPSSASAVRDET